MSLISRYSFFILLIASFYFIACDSVPKRPRPKKVVIVKEPEKLEPSIAEQIGVLLDNAVANNGMADDSISMNNADIVSKFYIGRANERIWSKDKQWLPIADSLMQMIDRAKEYGLFPADYHQKYLSGLFNAIRDTAKLDDAALWSRGDILFSDALVSYSRHLRWGHLGRDSISLNKDSNLTHSFYDTVLARVQESGSPRTVLEQLEPIHEAYHLLKAAIPSFLDSMDTRVYTFVEFPFKDSMQFVKQLQLRLFEDAYITFNTRVADSVEMAVAVKRAQSARGLKIDGKAGTQLVGSLNNTGPERFKRISINLDRFKEQFPDSMPVRYIFVNLASYKMKVIDSGEIILESKVIVGQPRTRTPVLHSAVVNFITYPQWTVPYSIIFKEMLPKIQKDVEYLEKEKLMVVDKYDSVIDPHTIDWSLLDKKHFPYLLRQRQGDDNSLGVIKFNFSNKYQVYMHDTNARSMFGRKARALSHGCVRVQSWDSLARYLISRDPNNIPMDSVHSWLARQEKHTVPLKKKIPVYLRYITCEVQENGRILFFDDIYGDDMLLRMKYLSKKQI
jgi:L,D-transpeptidase YcbB